MSKAEKYVRYFLSHRDITLELTSKIGQENYEYKPTPTSMTAKKLVTHMLESFYRFALVAKNGDASVFLSKLDVPEEDLDILAQTYTQHTTEILQSLTEENLRKTIDLTNILGIKVRASQLLQIAMDHEIHHKGNLFVYVRELGHTDLPMFVKKG